MPGIFSIFYGDEVGVQGLGNLFNRQPFPWGREDQDLLEDVIIENKQAIEMANIYSSILNSMMNAFASIISNNLNIVMKFLTAVTIVLSMPTMISSFYGMNVSLPFEHNPLGFLYVVILSVLVAVITALLLIKKGMF